MTEFPVRASRPMARDVVVPLVMCLFIFGNSGCVARVSNPGSLADVNGTVIQKKEVVDKLTRIHYRKTVGEVEGPAITEKSLKSLLGEIVDETLMYEEALRLGLDEDRAFQKKMDDYIIGESVRQLRKEEILAKIPEDDETIRGYAERNYRRMKGKAIFSTDRAWIAEQAGAIHTAEEFAAVSEALAGDAKEARVMDVAFVPRKNFPAGIADRLFDSREGDVCGPLPYGPGWAIFLVEEIKELDEAYYEANKEKIRARYRREKEGEIGDCLIEGYRRKAKIRINEALLDISEEEALKRKDDPIAWVNGDPILLGAYREARKNQMPHNRMGMPWETDNKRSDAEQQALDRLIRVRLVEQEALRRRFAETDPDFRSSFLNYKKKTLADFFRRKILAGAVKVREDEIERYYEKHKERYRPSPRVQYLLVVFSNGETAKSFSSELRQGANFDRLTESYQKRRKCDSMLHPWRPVSQLSPEMRSVLRDLRPGEFSGVLSMGNSFQIVKLTGRKEADLPPLSRIHEKIRMQIGSEKYNHLKEEYLSKLKATAKIRIHEDALEELRREFGVSSRKGPGKD